MIPARDPKQKNFLKFCETTKESHWKPSGAVCNQLMP